MQEENKTETAKTSNTVKTLKYFFIIFPLSYNELNIQPATSQVNIKFFEITLSKNRKFKLY